MKYSDNLYKGFGNSIAIVIANTFIGIFYHDVTLNGRFGIGSFLVLLSSVAYYSLTATVQGHGPPTSSTASTPSPSPTPHSASLNAYVVINSALADGTEGSSIAGSEGGQSPADERSKEEV